MSGTDEAVGVSCQRPCRLLCRRLVVGTWLAAGYVANLGHRVYSMNIGLCDPYLLIDEDRLIQPRYSSLAVGTAHADTPDE